MSSSRSAVLPGYSGQPRIRLGGTDAAEDASAAADAEESVSAVAREELVPELLSQRDAAREHVGRKQPLEEVVVAAVAVASREAEHAGDGVRLEHRTNGVRRHTEPVGRRPLRALEVE